MSPSRSDYTGPPLVAGTRRAYRSWRLHDGMLASVTQKFFWRSKYLEAECVKDAAVITMHRSPDEACWCGIYAKYRLSDIEYEFTRDVEVYGAIDAYGKVLEGTKGIRAEKATIRGLLVPNFINSWNRKNIRGTYGVPIFSYRDELLEAFPEDEDVPTTPIRIDAQNKMYGYGHNYVSGCPCTACQTKPVYGMNAKEILKELDLS